MGERRATKKSWIWGIVILMGLALFAAIFMRIASRMQEGVLPESSVMPLAAAIPANLKGWESRSLALSDTEEGARDVEKTLRYDEVFYREYSSPRGRLLLYAAYWTPRKMPPHLVASHTPDICWAITGWNCLEKRKDERISWSGPPLWPAQGRRFESAKGDLEHVLFWHLVDGKPYDIGLGFNQTPNPFLYWRDALRFQLGWSKAQFFIRLSSNRPYDSLQGDPGWEQLLTALSTLGLREEGKR
ncbi:MAG: exosortase-associated EpsI family protein [Opitutaceae bacterium]|jgi:hypothetical protein